MKRFKGILLAVSVALAGSVLAGCAKDNKEIPQTEENGTNAGEVKAEPVTAGGWEFTIEEAIADSALENVSVELGYTNVETSSFKQEAEEGNEYCLVKMQIDKIDSSEDIQWEKLILKDGNGNEYSRMDDAFLTDLGMSRMSSADLNFGENEGWIAFEMKEGAENLTLTYAFDSDTYEAAINPADSVSTETAETGAVVISETPAFEAQTKVDESLASEAAAGHSFEEPEVVLDPYGTSPLTAVVIFTTEESTGVNVTVKGKAAEDDISGSFAAAKEHIIPIYGLYNGDTTQVELTLDDGTSTTLDITTELQELNIGEVTAEMLDESVYDYSNLTLACSTAGTLYAMDSKGDVRWCYNDGGTLGVHQLSNGHLMVPTSYTLRSTYYKSGLKEIDFSGKVYKEYAIPGGMHHDFYEMSNGNILVASDSPDLSTVEDYVVEIDPSTGRVVWELDMADLLDKEDGASASNLTDGGEEIDWFHNNGVWYDEANDLVLMSARHIDAIVAVHKSDKTLAWILGDPDGWSTVDKSYFFTPVGDNFEWQYAQHQVTMLDNGDIMLFDNGTAKVKREDADQKVTGDDIYSRAVVYRIDTENMTIEQIFEYGKERGPEWYSDWISGSISLDGTQNNLWITAGSNLYNPEEDSHEYYPSDMFVPGLIKTTHIDQVVNGELAYEITVSGDTYGSLTYRSMRVPMYTENASLDITKAGVMLGELGETSVADAEVSLEDAEALDTAGWTFALDETKFTLAGVYETDTKAEELKDAYLILKEGENVKTYTITQNGTDGDEKTSVNVSGWTSVNGLEGGLYDIYLVLDGKTYQTGRQVEFAYDYVQYEEDGTPYYGYYKQAVEVEMNPTDTMLISENDENSGIKESTLEEEKSLISDTQIVDNEIQTEMESGKHTWEKPLVLTNPYKISPLTAVVVFNTEESCKVRVTVKGKEKAYDITGEIDAAASHRVPVVGLYAGEENTVILELLDDNGEVTDSQELKIQTDDLSDHFDGAVEVVESSGESAFGLTLISGQSSYYPYAIDGAGDIRWYIQRQAGNYGVFALSNQRIIFQDRDGDTPAVRKPFYTNLYEMDYMGRAYQMYYVANGTHHEVIEKEPDGNLLILSSSLNGHEEEYIIEMDRETGEVVKTLDLIDVFDESMAAKVDWAHLNTISYNEEDDSILLSPRNIHAGIKVNWSTNELIWILSDPEIWEGTGYEEYVLQPEGEFNWHYQQHTVYEVGADLDGNPDTVEISMFDNHCDYISRTDAFDGLTESYSKIYSINEAEKTVTLLKEFACLQSDITSNTIYDVESGHLFSMSSQLREPLEGRHGMIYEYDYESEELLNQISIRRTFYRAIEMNLDWNDLAQNFETQENYITGVLRPLIETDAELETPTRTWKADDVSFKRKGSVLYVKTPSKTISQVIFKSNEHTYVFDDTKNHLQNESYMAYESDMVMPMNGLESGDYEIWVVYENVLYNTGETVKK